MAATANQVKEITGTALADATITPFITAAGYFMAQIEDCLSESLTTAGRDDAEAYLAAHLLVSSNVGSSARDVAEESLRGKYSVKYLMPKASGQGVLSTHYGQTANAMTGGCLAQLDGTPIGVFSIGSIDAD